MRYSSGAGSDGSVSRMLAGTLGSGWFSGYLALTLNGIALGGRRVVLQHRFGVASLLTLQFGRKQPAEDRPKLRK